MTRRYTVKVFNKKTQQIIEIPVKAESAWSAQWVAKQLSPELRILSIEQQTDQQPY